MQIRDVKKEVTIPFTFTNNTFIASFSVNRIDYHVGDDSGMNAHAENNLLIDVSVPVTKM